MNDSLGKNIAAQRHRANMTQEQLAELSDITINYLSKVERGVIKQISSASLYRLAQALNVSMEDLIEGNEVKTRPQPNRQLLIQEMDLLDPQVSEEYSKLFLDLIKLSND